MNDCDNRFYSCTFCNALQTNAETLTSDDKSPAALCQFFFPVVTCCTQQSTGTVFFFMSDVVGEKQRLTNYVELGIKSVRVLTHCRLTVFLNTPRRSDCRKINIFIQKQYFGAHFAIDRRHISYYRYCCYFECRQVAEARNVNSCRYVLRDAKQRCSTIENNNNNFKNNPKGDENIYSELCVVVTIPLIIVYDYLYYDIIVVVVFSYYRSRRSQRRISGGSRQLFFSIPATPFGHASVTFQFCVRGANV